MTDYSKLLAKIDALKAESIRDAITPMRLGLILEEMLGRFSVVPPATPDSAWYDFDMWRRAVSFDDNGADRYLLAGLSHAAAPDKIGLSALMMSVRTGAVHRVALPPLLPVSDTVAGLMTPEMLRKLNSVAAGSLDVDLSDYYTKSQADEKFLSGEDLFSLVLKAGSFAPATYNPAVKALQVNIPTKLSHLDNDRNFVDASTVAGFARADDVNKALALKLDAATFDDLFAKESDGKGGYRIRAKYALYSNQYLSCLGNNPDAGTIAAGATTLGGLDNVTQLADSVAAADKVLVRRAGASEWSLAALSDIVGLDTSALYNYLTSNHYAKLSDIPSLAGYATQSWVEAQGYATSTALTSAINSVTSQIAGKLDAATFDDLFVKEADGKGGYRIRAKYALYSNQYLSCLGNNPDAGTVAAGATTLGGLDNVVAAADEATAAAKVLVREAGASAWTLRSLSDIVGLDTSALASYLTAQGYATRAWVQQQGFLTEHQSLADYATKAWVEAKGYLTGITKAQVEAVLTGNISSHTHSQYLTSAIAAQTYQPKGDYATSSALSSAVSSLNTAIGAKLDAATFDDLFAKESDGKGGYRIRAKYALYSNQYLSCLGNNPDAGTATGGGVDLDAVQAYLTQQGYATQSWVQAQGYVTSLANYYTKAEVDAKVKYLPTYYVSRPTSANVNFGNAAGLYTFLATASMTTGKPAVDSHILHMEWDNGLSWAGQIAVPNSPTGMQWRYEGANSVWQPWRTILDTENYAATLNSKYVTVDTAQTITGVKTLGTRVSTSTGNIDRLIIVPYKHTAGPWKINSYDDSNEAWLRFMYGPTETITFNNNGVFFANAIRKRGGTSSQFLKADGSVDSNTYLTAHQSLDYINNLGRMAAVSGTTTIPWGLRLYQVYANGYPVSYGNLLRIGGGGSGELLCGWTADTSVGELYYRSKRDVATTAWSDWARILTSVNYSSVLDSRYVNASGDTMTGYLYLGSTSAHIFADTTYGAWLQYGSDYINIRNGELWKNNATRYWHAGNDGHNSGLDADLLDGLHSNSFMGNASATWTNGETVIAWAKRLGWANPTLYNETVWGWAYSKSLTIGSYTIDSQRYSALDFRRGNLNEAWTQKAIMFLPTYGDVDMIYIAQMSVSGTGGEVTLSAVRRYATYDTILASNVASATRLQTARSIWGQSFDGTGNVTGNMTGVGTINSAAAPINTIYASNWYRSIGATGWYNETYGGGWYMSDTQWIRAHNNKGIFSQGEFLSGYCFVRDGYAGRPWNRGYGALGVGIINNEQQTPLVMAYRSGTAIDIEGANRLFSMELLNSGTQLRFGFGGTLRFLFTSNGVFSSSTGMYSDGYMSCLGKNDGSDERLKSIIGHVALPIEVILGAPAVRFTWNANAGAVMAGKVAVGTTAQYWLEHLAEVVGTMPTGYYGVNYGALDWVAIHSVAKYAKTEIELLKEENKKLKERVAALERRLGA